jgi:AbrB family looped-hinge helix DNA binding protein
MSQATITSKGQITIPADVQRALAVGEGDRLEFVPVRPGEFLVIAINRSVTELKGMFAKPAKAVPIEDMALAIACLHGSRGGSGRRRRETQGPRPTGSGARAKR